MREAAAAQLASLDSRQRLRVPSGAIRLASGWQVDWPVASSVLWQRIGTHVGLEVARHHGTTREVAVVDSLGWGTAGSAAKNTALTCLQRCCAINGALMPQAIYYCIYHLLYLLLYD